MRTHSMNPSRFSDSRKIDFSKLPHIIGRVLLGLLIALLFALVFGYLVKLLWGLTLTPLFGVVEPTYWQAVGIVILTRLLFGGLGHRWDKTKSSPVCDRLHESFHGWSHNREEVHETPTDLSEDSSSYREFWEKEGKAAFQAYLDRIGKKS